MNSILIAVIDPAEAGIVADQIPPAYSIDQAFSADQTLRKTQENNYDVLFISTRLLDQFLDADDYRSIFRKIRNTYPLIRIVVISQADSLRKLVKAMKQGANDYLTLPVNSEEVVMVLSNLSEAIIRRTELDYLRDKFWKLDAFDVIRTECDGMKDVFKKIRSVAPTKATVLLAGETGTGKGVMARLIHQHSNRANGGFISVHCGAIPETLLESELFGHEKGAFTGATRKKLGKFEIASNGTIFLDEVGTITPAAQIKLLQVLQDGTFSRVGDENTIHANARIIAATNTDLKVMSENGLFRKDLFYRLNVFPIEIPPLRERREDLPHLVNIFLDQFNRRYQKKIIKLHPAVLDAMQTYDWPGNVRELENLIERAFIVEAGSVLMPDDFPSELMGDTINMKVPMDVGLSPLADARRAVLESFEKKYLSLLLTRNNGRINKSASEAGIGVRQLHKLMQKYNIKKKFPSGE